MIVSTLCAAFLLNAPVAVESRFEQVAPTRENGKLERSPNRERAIVLIHGFVVHFSEESVSRAAPRSWQQPGSLLIKRLSREGDVFSFCYAQSVAVEDVVSHTGLKDTIARLKNLGYAEIVVVGHSAGGLVARCLVEDCPECGVTRVVQVCTPNGGTPAAELKVTAMQQAFLDSLTADGREKCLKARSEKKIPAGVEFVCVLGNKDGKSDSDGLVPCPCQWTPDLQKQCIPVVPVGLKHHETTRTEKGADLLARLVSEKQPRWKSEEVDRLCKELFKK